MMRVATWVSSASPTSWPTVSLTSFSRSTSMNRMATLLRVPRMPSSASAAVRSSSRRFGQAGERVVVGLAGELALQVLGGGDVAGDATPVLDDAVGGAVHAADRCRACAPGRRGRGTRPRPTTCWWLVAFMTSRGTWSRMACSRPRAAGSRTRSSSSSTPNRRRAAIVGVHGRAVAVEDDDGVVGGADHALEPVEQHLLRHVLGVVEGAAAVADDAADACRARAWRRCGPRSSGLRRATPGTRDGCRRRPPWRAATPVRRWRGRRDGRWPTAARRPENRPTLHERAECCIGRGDATVAVGLEQAHRQRREQLVDVRHPYKFLWVRSVYRLLSGSAEGAGDLGRCDFRRLDSASELIDGPHRR